MRFHGSVGQLTTFIAFFVGESIFVSLLRYILGYSDIGLIMEVLGCDDIGDFL